MTTARSFDISAASRALGYEPQVALDQGMKRLRAWLAQDVSSAAHRSAQASVVMRELTTALNMLDVPTFSVPPGLSGSSGFS